MLMFDRESYRLLDGNTAAEQCLDFTQENLLDLKLTDLFLPQDWDLVQQTLRTPLLEPEHGTHRWRMRARKGNVIDIDVLIEHLSHAGVETSLLQFWEVKSSPTQQQVPHSQLGHTEHSMLESLSDGFFHLDREGRFTYLNRRAQNFFHATAESLLGRFVWDCYPMVQGSEHRRRHEMAMESQQANSYELYYEPGQQWHEVRLYPSQQGVSVCFRDVTQRRGVWQRLLEEREILSAIVNSTHEAVISVDSSGCIQSFNPSAERIFGISESDALGSNVDQLLPERFRITHAQHRADFLRAKPNSPRMMGLRMVKGLRSDGKELELEGSISKASIDERAVLIVSLRDMTQQLAIETEREHTRDQLSRLTHRLMSQEKDLVKRIAQVLHDQLGQTMAAIRLVHEAIGTLRKGSASPELKQMESRLTALIEQAISQVRVVLVELQPPMLDEHGLVVALDNELRRRARSTTGMHFVLEAPPEMAKLRWSPTVEYAAFMISREAVENAVRHAQATRLVLTVSGDASGLTLDIQDNGRGITARSNVAPGHLGWTNIVERANSIGATVRMEPGAQGGTCVHFHWQGNP